MASQTPPTDDPSDEDQNCPCNLPKQGNHIMVQCGNKNCQNEWWHAVCAGFQNPKKAAIKAVGDWFCPICIIDNLPEHHLAATVADKSNSNF